MSSTASRLSKEERVSTTYVFLFLFFCGEKENIYRTASYLEMISSQNHRNTVDETLNEN